ncbi:hypothetical protein [Microbacterium sulfonylureivorans]|uniref:hypothetical protein n=1 Tax=Microbacterium sulfonylureivorans TaxID=2486854 RepID=UPI000FDC68D2|nr:hypothetical protein [Microbacterium sulfonylureivorans]
MKVTMKWNQQGLRQLERDIAAGTKRIAEEAIEKLDRSARAQFGGKPADEIREPIQRLFANGGVNVTDPELGGYVDAVSGNSPFKWHVSLR